MTPRVLSITYTLWKSIVQTKGFAQFHVAMSGDMRVLFAGNPDLIYSADIHNSTDRTDWEAAFPSSTAVPTEDEAIANITGLGDPITPRSPNSYVQVSVHPAETAKTTRYTQNWADATTWYEGATRQVDQALTDSGDHLTYNVPAWSSKKHIVDVYHGKITNEHLLLDSGANSYRVVVKVNGQTKTEQDPHVGSGGDFTVDYDAGSVTFLSALQGSDAVTMTYHLVDRTAGDGSASCWTLKPDAGKILEIAKVEVQFSDNIVLTDDVSFQAFASPPGVPVGNEDIYKTMSDYYNDANGAYPVMPTLGGSGWRGCSEPVYALPWQYQAVTKLDSTQNIEVRLCLKHDEPFGSDNANPASATATFYCLSVDA